jgi:hypothetical protein
MAALRARTTLLAREASAVGDLTRLGEIVAKLPEGEKGFLRQTPQLRQLVQEISELQIRLNTIARPLFREPTARLIVTKVENFSLRSAGYTGQIAAEFRAAAVNWKQIADRQLDKERTVVSKEPTLQVFRAGDPVDRDKEAFVLRYQVVGELERQVMLSAGCPGLVLYGRRRMGKSTVLRNLEGGFLPISVLPVAVSMQDPRAFTSLQDFLRHIAQEMQAPTGIVSAPANLIEFYGFLVERNRQLGREEKRILLAIDEYQMIDFKIGEGVFPVDLLNVIRESIQTHRQITWLFAGSHEITELRNAPWSSYLVSARTINVPAFEPDETRLLLTEPLKHSRLAKDLPNPVRFDSPFWGERGIERIHAESAGWPHLVQLIAETAVDLLNDEEARSVTNTLLERAVNKAIEKGHNVLYQLIYAESTPPEWDYLSAFRKRTEQAPPEDEAVYRSLRRRELVAEENGLWHLRVPLMARWLRERG